MAKAELKTRPNDASVDEFLKSVTDEAQRADAYRVLEIFKTVTGDEPKMWGPAIVGFGRQMLKYASGRELDWPIAAFSPRKDALTLYLSVDGYERYDEHLSKLGKHKTGKSCLYIKRLSDVDEKVLTNLIKDSVKHVKAAKDSASI
jgi:hypothetical protein